MMLRGGCGGGAVLRQSPSQERQLAVWYRDKMADAAIGRSSTISTAPPRRFGSPLQLSQVHWVRPDVVVE